MTKTTAAALAASAAVANAANALRADPVFEAIEVHKAARLAFENAVSRGSALDEELPNEKTRSWITVWEQTIIETDDPRWIDSVREVNRTSNAETDAACALVSIAPTPMAGVVRLLQYAISIRPEEWPEELQSGYRDPAMALLSDRNAGRCSARHGGAIMSARPDQQA